MVKRYKIKLSAESPAEHNVRGYLGGWGEIYTYSRGEAIKKARAFKGKIEPVSYGFISTDVKVGLLDEMVLLDSIMVKLAKIKPHYPMIFPASIFKDLLDTHVAFDKTRTQLEELNDYFRYHEYVMIVKTN